MTAGPSFAVWSSRERSFPTLTIKNFWIADFQCSSHRRRNGRRHDMVAPMGHDRFDGCPYNQWIYRGPTLGLGDPLHPPFRGVSPTPRPRPRAGSPALPPFWRDPGGAPPARPLAAPAPRPSRLQPSTLAGLDAGERHRTTCSLLMKRVWPAGSRAPPSALRPTSSAFPT